MPIWLQVRVKLMTVVRFTRAVWAKQYPGYAVWLEARRPTDGGVAS